MCELLQHGGGGFFLPVVPIAHQRHERRDATVLSDLSHHANSEVPLTRQGPVPRIGMARITIFVIEILHHATAT